MNKYYYDDDQNQSNLNYSPSNNIWEGEHDWERYMRERRSNTDPLEDFFDRLFKRKNNRQDPTHRFDPYRDFLDNRRANIGLAYGEPSDEQGGQDDSFNSLGYSSQKPAFPLYQVGKDNRAAFRELFGGSDQSTDGNLDGGQSSAGKDPGNQKPTNDHTESEKEYDASDKAYMSSYDVDEVPNPQNPKWESIALALLPSLFGAGTNYIGQMVNGYMGGQEQARKRLEAMRQEEMRRRAAQGQVLGRRGDRKREDETNKHTEDRDDWKTDTQNRSILNHNMNLGVADIHDSIEKLLSDNGTWTANQDEKVDGMIHQLVNSLRDQGHDITFEQINARIRRPKAGARSNKSIQGQVDTKFYASGNREFDDMAPGPAKRDKARELREKGDPTFKDMDDATIDRISQIPSVGKQQDEHRFSSRSRGIIENAKAKQVNVTPEDVETIARETMSMDDQFAANWSGRQITKLQLREELFSGNAHKAREACNKYMALIVEEKKMLDRLKAELEGFRKANPSQFDSRKLAQVGFLMDQLQAEAAKFRVIKRNLESMKSNSIELPTSDGDALPPGSPSSSDFTVDGKPFVVPFRGFQTPGIPNWPMFLNQNRKP